ncbi:hypothetical protein [Acinetobacter baumannii]|uniref:hypothetical protein n=1 Tax=Acinetobacter baumannii TaxID=470 RepID=UPI001D1758C7|nr:hypothetical protein [Acinetobacter baumannii]
MKLLNIENISVKSDRFIEIAGKKHELKIMSVGEFTQFVKDAREIAASRDTLRELEFPSKLLALPFQTFLLRKSKSFNFLNFKQLLRLLADKTMTLKRLMRRQTKRESKCLCAKA